MQIRINKYLADQGYCSRREADRLIQSGKVRINGDIAKVGAVVTDDDIVEVAGTQAKRKRTTYTYIALHKPVGYMTTTDRKKKDTVMDLVHVNDRLFPIGRLDVESSGLLLLTSDGEFANKLMHPRYGHEKEYEVEVDKPVRMGDLMKLRKGVTLEDGKTQPAWVQKEKPNVFRITIREGRNRQIRRMCEALGYRVVKLKRLRVANIKLGSLKPGRWRRLTESELKRLKLKISPPNS